MCVLQEEAGDSEEEEGAVFLDLSGLQQAKELQVLLLSYSPTTLTNLMLVSPDISAMYMYRSRPYYPPPPPPPPTHTHTHTHTQSEAVVKGAMQSTVDTQEWRLEVERVLPSLKVHVRQDNRVSIN